MPLSSKIAYRYLFNKKENNFINIISYVTMITFAIGCAVLIIILSVFNGLHGVIEGMFNQFNPDLQIIPSQGKVISVSEEQLISILERDEVRMMTPVLEETAVLYNDQTKVVAKIKGVDPLYFEHSQIGELSSTNQLSGDKVILGRDLQYRLGINEDDPFAHVDMFLANRNYKPLPGRQPITKRTLLFGGFFTTNAEFDGTYGFTSLGVMQSFLNRVGEFNSLEIELVNPNQEEALRAFLNDLLGEDTITIQNSYQQEESYYKLLRMEKLIAYVITIFVLLLILFNLMACLWMIVMEKEKDLSILRSIGLNRIGIRNIFFLLGIFYCLIGGGIGILIGTIIIWLQKNFGLVRMGANYVVDYFPVELQWTDVGAVLLTVLCLGWIASLPAALRAGRTETNFSYE